MSRLTVITDRALELATQAGASLKQAVPSADKLLQTGAALGAVKTGGKVAVAFVRRNPVVAVAAALGVGVLAYAAHRKRKREEQNAPIEGKSKRVEAKRVNGAGKRGGGTSARKPSATGTRSGPSAEA
jgi:methylthioribose-1-phosphate isomerase